MLSNIRTNLSSNYAQIFKNTYLLSIPIVLIYSFLKEREEFGCKGWTIKKQCNELESVYLRGTQYKKTDTKNTLYAKLKKVMSLIKIVFSK